MFAPDNLAQAINPWTWWFKATDNVTGLININNYKSANPETERKIIHEVAGYGMQLGAIEDVLEILLQAMPAQKLNPDQEKSIQDFRKMVAEIKDKKEQALVEQMCAGGVDRMIEGLELLKKKHPERYEAVARRLKAAL